MQDEKKYLCSMISTVHGDKDDFFYIEVNIVLERSDSSKMYIALGHNETFFKNIMSFFVMAEVYTWDGEFALET